MGREAMNDNVVRFTGLTRLDTPVESVIQEAAEAELVEVVVIGFDKDGGFYLTSSKADGGAVMWLLAMAQRLRLDMAIDQT